MPSPNLRCSHPTTVRSTDAVDRAQLKSKPNPERTAFTAPPTNLFATRNSTRRTTLTILPLPSRATRRTISATPSAVRCLSPAITTRTSRRPSSSGRRNGVATGWPDCSIRLCPTAQSGRGILTTSVRIRIPIPVLILLPIARATPAPVISIRAIWCHSIQRIPTYRRCCRSYRWRRQDRTFRAGPTLTVPLAHPWIGAKNSSAWITTSPITTV